VEEQDCIGGEDNQRDQNPQCEGSFPSNVRLYANTGNYAADREACYDDANDPEHEQYFRWSKFKLLHLIHHFLWLNNNVLCCVALRRHGGLNDGLRIRGAVGAAEPKAQGMRHKMLLDSAAWGWSEQKKRHRKWTTT
jgi:hypothetical protein